MEKQKAILLMGFWFALLVTLLNIGSTLLPLLTKGGFSSFILGFPVAILFVIMLVSVHYYAPEEKRIFSLIGVAFSIACVALLGFNYYFMMCSSRLGELPALLNLTNPNSIIWVVEILGYGFMGLSTLFAAFVFGRGKLAKTVKWLFIVHGILGIGGMVGYALEWNMTILLGGLIFWDILFPLMTLCLAILFKKELKSNDYTYTSECPSK